MKIVIAIPAYNEEKIIMCTLRTVFERLHTADFKGDMVTVVVADNGSTDATTSHVRAYMKKEKSLAFLSVPIRGKGNAVFSAWEQHPADIAVFLDADLSADIEALPELIRMVREDADIAVASRFAPGALVSRSLSRRIFSLVLRRVLWLSFGLSVRDAPCGMKAVSRRVVRELVPHVRDRAWFFDTELLIRAERLGYRIVEVPVRWSDAADKNRPSHVGVMRVISSYCFAIFRLRFLL